MIGITYSDSHPIPRELLKTELSALGDYQIVEVEIPSGGVDQPAEGAFADVIAECEALFVRPGIISRNLIESAPNLRAIQTIGSGYDHIDVEAATDNDILVSHSPEAPNQAVAEHTIGMMVSLVRNFPSRMDGCAKGNWMNVRRTSFPEIGACTVGIVGLGAIGLEVTERIGMSFGSKIIGHDPYIDPAVSDDIDFELIDDLTEILTRSDIVSLHVPLTDETKYMIDVPEVEALEGSYLINTCRGGVISESALAAGIDELEGAALDVFETEPPDPDHPLLNAPNVQVTPHIAGASDQTMERGVRFGAEKIHEMLRGDRPATVIN